PAARGAPPRGAAGGSGPASPAQLDEAAGQLRQPGGLLPPCWEGAQPVGHRAASAPTREHEGFRSAPPAPLLAAAGPAVAAPPAEAAPVAPPQVSDADLSASLRRRREELAALGRGPRRFLVRTQLGFLNVHREPGDPYIGEATTWSAACWRARPAAGWSAPPSADAARFGGSKVRRRMDLLPRHADQRIGRFRFARGRRVRRFCGSSSVGFGPRPFSLKGGVLKGSLSTAEKWGPEGWGPKDGKGSRGEYTLLEAPRPWDPSPQGPISEPPTRTFRAAGAAAARPRRPPRPPLRPRRRPPLRRPLADGQVFHHRCQMQERGGWLRHDRGGWSVRFFGGFEWLQPIEEDGTAS
ncbi:unnamed protein product, partial [Prorocentrum cordatum]